MARDLLWENEEFAEAKTMPCSTKYSEFRNWKKNWDHQKWAHFCQKASCKLFVSVSAIHFYGEHLRRTGRNELTFWAQIGFDWVNTLLSVISNQHFSTMEKKWAHLSISIFYKYFGHSGRYGKGINTVKTKIAVLCKTYFVCENIFLDTKISLLAIIVLKLWAKTYIFGPKSGHFEKSRPLTVSKITSSGSPYAETYS